MLTDIERYMYNKKSINIYIYLVIDAADCTHAASIMNVQTYIERAANQDK